ASLREVARLLVDIGGPSAGPLKAAAASGAIKMLNRISTLGAAASRALRKAPVAWAPQVSNARAELAVAFLAASRLPHKPRWPAFTFDPSNWLAIEKGPQKAAHSA